MTEFEKELKSIINKHSLENQSNTPDFILAKFLSSCLSAYNEAVQKKADWFGHPVELPDKPTECK